MNIGLLDSPVGCLDGFENLDLDQLSADGAYEFLFSWAPIKLVGGTGAPGNPIAAY